MAALAVAAVCCGAALAGGTARCRIVLTPASGERVDAQSAQAAGAIAIAPVPAGYCPGGLPYEPQKNGEFTGHAGGKVVKAPSAGAIEIGAEIDALDAGLLAKAEFAEYVKILSIKLEALEPDAQGSVDKVWKIDVTTGAHEEWCIELDVRDGAVLSKKGRAADGTPIDGGIDDLALKNPEYAGGSEQDPVHAKPFENADTQPVDCVPDVLKGEEVKAIDMFAAIELVAMQLERKEAPSPLPTEKVTDRPQPGKGVTDSTGSRW
jgi:hypothetical protein